MSTTYRMMAVLNEPMQGYYYFVDTLSPIEDCLEIQKHSPAPLYMVGLSVMSRHEINDILDDMRGSLKLSHLHGDWYKGCVTVDALLRHRFSNTVNIDLQALLATTERKEVT